jgi:hypothetical protein
MDILNLGGINEPSERPSKKKLKVIIGIGLLAGVMGMGSTLAASITLNGGTAVEFGQGVQLVTACDPEITVTPTASFVNGTTAPQSGFRLATVTLSDIDEACLGKKLRLNAYTDSDTYTVYTQSNAKTSPIAFSWNYTTTGNKFGGSSVSGTAKNVGCELSIDPSTWSSSTISCGLNGGSAEGSPAVSVVGTSGQLVITFATGTASGAITQPVAAAAIDKFTLESNA